MVFTVNVLVYGPHADLAGRCLDGIVKAADPALVTDIRVGLNAVTPETRLTVVGHAEASRVPVHLYEESGGRNVMKYPLMRRMLYDPARPQAGHVVWFDDDSYIRPPYADWFSRMFSLVRREKPDLVGSLYTPGYNWTPPEVEKIKAQPWYAGKPLRPGPKFVTGGWWVARRDFLHEFDYPIRELRHNGGDVLLGEICRQQGARVVRHNETVCINYDEARGGESRAIRRGIQKTPRPFENGGPPDMSHHDFELDVWTYPGRAE